jgi:hypothetical protein
MFVDSVIQKTLNGVQGEASSKVDTDAAGAAFSALTQR